MAKNVVKKVSPARKTLERKVVKSVGHKSLSKPAASATFGAKATVAYGAKATGAVKSAELVGKAVVGKGPIRGVVNGKSAVAVRSAVADTDIALKPLAVVAKEVRYEEFKEKDKVVYPAHGVGIIDAVQTRKVSGSEQKFYMLTILETGMKIMVPVGQAQVVGLRRIVDSKTVEKVYEILKDRKVTIDTQTWNRRYREYTQKIKTGSVFEIAKVIRDLSMLRGDKELSFGERKMLDTAQGLLVKEISIAKSSPEDSVKAELDKLFVQAVLPI